jgi:hypothetical protein
MKKILFVTLMILLLQVPQSFMASSAETDADGAAAAPPPAAQKSDRYPDSEDDIFSTTYERELLSRRFFEKTLPPLQAREKIIWSYKTSKSNIFL